MLFRSPVAGGEPERVTSGEGAARYPKWRPDGTAILYEVDCAADGSQAAPKSSARIFEEMPVRFWNKWLDERRPHPLVIELSPGAKPRDLLKDTAFARSPGFRGGAFRQTELDTTETLAAQWAPDGGSVVFAAQTSADSMMHVESEIILEIGRAHV